MQVHRVYERAVGKPHPVAVGRDFVFPAHPLDVLGRCDPVDAERILKKIEGIHFQYFSEEDVVRHPLVSEIVKAYEGSRQGASNGKKT